MFSLPESKLQKTAEICHCLMFHGFCHQLRILTHALSEAIPIMEKLIEMMQGKVKVATMAAIKCNVYEDKSEDTGKVVKTHKYR